MRRQDFLTGLEAIDVQINSQVGNALEKIFQAEFDFKETLTVENLSLQDRLEYDKDPKIFVIDRVYDHFVRYGVPAIKKVFSNMLGLNLRKVNVSGGRTMPWCSLMFAIDLNFNDKSEMETIFARPTGMNSENIEPGSKGVIEALEKLSNSFDIKTGTLKKSDIGKVKIEVPALYIDSNFAFCSELFVNTKYAEPMTVQEVTAIILHEIGHAMCTIEHASDLYYIKKRSTMIGNSLRKCSNSDVKDIIKYLDKTGLPKLRKMLDKMPKDTSEAKATERMSNTLSTMVKSITIADSKYDILNTLIGRPLLILVNFILIVYLEIFGFFLLMCFGCYHFTDIVSSINLSDDVRGARNSDMGTAKTRMFQAERWADEYATRQGYGAELGSGLNKIYDCIAYSQTPGSGIFVQSEGLWRMLFNIEVSITRFFNIGFYMEPQIYENQFERAVRICENMYGMFKECQNIPGPVVDLWLRNLKQAEKNAKEAKQWDNSAFAKCIAQFIYDINSPVDMIRLIGNGNLMKDLTNLENHIDRMNNNKLFALGAKIGRIK